MSHIVEPASDPGRTYEVRVDGHLDDRWSAWLGVRALVRDDDAATTLVVEVADQAQLHSVLTAIRDLGVGLLSLRVMHPAGDR
jgi:hypothetical protein